MSEGRSDRRRPLIYAGLMLGTAVVTLGVVAVLVTIFERKQEAREPFVRVVEVDELSTDPAPWGQNWPHHYDAYLKTAEGAHYGGSSAMPASKLEAQPWLKRLYAGYAFSIDYREARGHAYMLYDQTVTERVTKRKQAGACLHCHASNTVMYRTLGREALGRSTDPETMRDDFDMPAVIAGFEAVSKRPYEEVLALVKAAPDGTPDDDGESGGAHPVSCIDCHDPKTMRIRVTRPGFVQGIAALAAGDAPVPHLPSVEKWRAGDREAPYDPNTLASRNEMRSFVCGQCHVEYYCANKMTLTFPWAKGLRAEDLEATWDGTTFPDGTPFYDYTHGETGAPVLKVQHPEFELWSQGIHAQSGVSCADCHMPYTRVGAMKLSDHDVDSPLANINRACQTCHPVAEGELKARVETIQQRTRLMTERAAAAMVEMLDAILEAKAAGASEAALQPVYALQRKAMWRLDYISSENSVGFHADQEAMRILAESIDYSRQAQTQALRLRAPSAPAVDGLPRQSVLGVTPTAAAPTAVPEAAPVEAAPVEAAPVEAAPAEAADAADAAAAP